MRRILTLRGVLVEDRLPQGRARAGDDRDEPTAAAEALAFADGQYKYVWKTDKSWAGTCRDLRVLLVDGTLHTARFSFK